MNQYSNSATRQLLNNAGDLTSWLRTCVAAFVEYLASAPNTASANRPMIFAAGNHVEIYRGQNSQPAARLDGPLGELATQTARILGGGLRKGVGLRIGGDRAVVKLILLPEGAHEVAQAVIRNKVESLAPWPLHEVLWGYREVPTSQSGQISFEVGIISRKTVDGLLAPFRAAGVEIAHLDISEYPDELKGIDIDFHGSTRAKTARRVVATVMSAAALAALMAATFGSYLAVTTSLELTTAEQRIAELRQALAGGSGSSTADSKLAEANRLHARKSGNVPFVGMINELTKRVPDGTWLNSIDYGAEKVVISGRGVETTKVIESLESSEVFADVNFASATQRDAELNLDIFSISATVQSKVPAR
jgi:general secretion pathway protein L